MARIEVRDNGIGIDAADLPFVFERFWRADRGPTETRHGLGLGLAIARELIRLHDGTIVARSAGRGQGATFIVTLPIVAQPPLSTGGAAMHS